MTVDDLGQFLTDRYDEAEALAKACAELESAAWKAVDENVRSHDGGGSDVVTALERETAAFIAANGPARRLADIRLKRAILAEHKHVREDHAWSGKTDLDGPFGCSTCDFDSEYGQCPGGWCATVRQLGTEYAECDGYRDEWRPET